MQNCSENGIMWACNALRALYVIICANAAHLMECDLMDFKKYLYFGRYFKVLHLIKFDLAFCILYMISALIICVYSTPRGSLISPDSPQYIYDADNFLKIFPIYYSAPTYPALISIGTLFGLTSEQSAGLVPILSYSLMGFPLYFIGKSICGPIYSYVICIICLICGEYMLHYATYILNDLPFMLFSMITLLIIMLYTKYHTPILIYAAGLVLSVTLFTRLIGMSLIPAGIIALALCDKPLKKAMIPILQFCLLPAISLITWAFYMNRTYYLFSGSQELMNSLKLPINLNMLKFIEYAKELMIQDENIRLFILILLCSFFIFLLSKKQLINILIKSAPILSYFITYSILVIIATSSLPIGFEHIPLSTIRYVVPIYPLLILLIVLLFYYVYKSIDSNHYKFILKILSIILLILILIQGLNSLYIESNDIRSKSLTAYSDRVQLYEYISENNISNLSGIYTLNDGIHWPRDQLSLYEIASNKRYRSSYAIASLNRLPELIKSNSNLPIYIIACRQTIQKYILPSNHCICILSSNHCICLSNHHNFSDSVIYKASLPDNCSQCNLSLTEYRILNNSELISPYCLSGHFYNEKWPDRYRDQLLIPRTNTNNMQRNMYPIQILDFVHRALQKQTYLESKRIIGENTNNSSVSRLSGNFMGLGYDQIFSIIRNPDNSMINIDDFSQEKSPAIIRYSETLSNTSPLNNLADPEDAQLVGDFLALGHSQVLFMDRSSNEKQLMLADFTKNKTAQFTEIPLTGDSARIARWLDKDDLQFAGDFMGLGYSQVLFVNRNHTKDEKEKLILLDFSNRKSTSSIKYLENWKESSLLSGWLDANDTQLVGDFMGLGHSQVLFVNHAKRGGKIAIVDFSKSKGKPPALAVYIDRWNSSDLFEGWLGLNDTKIAGDFKGLGYSQVLFLNSSNNGTTATIVEFASGKPLIAI